MIFPGMPNVQHRDTNMRRYLYIVMCIALRIKFIAILVMLFRMFISIDF